MNRHQSTARPGFSLRIRGWGALLIFTFLLSTTYSVYADGLGLPRHLQTASFRGSAAGEHSLNPAPALKTPTLTPSPFPTVAIVTADLAGWKLPLPAGKYAVTQADARNGGTYSHNGPFASLRCAIDIAGDHINGMPVLAPYEGVVLEVGYDSKGDAGNYIEVAHPGGYISGYFHLKDNSFNVKKGDRVLQGSVLALVDSSGRSSGPHLHFFLYSDSTQTGCALINALDGNMHFKKGDIIVSTNHQIGSAPNIISSPVAFAPPLPTPGYCAKMETLDINPPYHGFPGGSIDIDAKITPGNCFRAVRLLIDGQVMLESGSPEISYNWDISGVSPGNHRLRFEIGAPGDDNWSDPIVYEQNYIILATPAAADTPAAN